MKKSVGIIGAGFSGLSAASFLAKEGFKVTIFEKNDTAGGRARHFFTDGFTFDMGPSWYWMPDVFSRFFHQFGRKESDFYQLVRLDPAYRVFFSAKDYVDISADLEKLYETFENIEKGSASKLKHFLKDAAIKYEIGMKNLVYKPAHSIRDYMNWRIITGILKMNTFKSISNIIRSNFKDIRLIRILEFPVLFLGATPQKTPSLYSLMNFADLVLGTWYPAGGMYQVVKAFITLAEQYGVKILTESPVGKITIKNNEATGITASGQFYPFGYVIGTADYHHVETSLIDSPYRSYTNKYWESRVMAPSAVLLFLGISKKLKNMLHHNILFDTDFEAHASEIYRNPSWPRKPSVYISCTSKTDETVAPQGYENVVALIPVATGLQDDDAIREYYYHYIIDNIERIAGEKLRDHIVYKRIYSHRDFIQDYHAFKGNAYGLANTISQTAILKPKMKSRKVKNLLFAEGISEFSWQPLESLTFFHGITQSTG